MPSPGPSGGAVHGVETAARIRRIAAELGYRAKALARALPTGRTSMIALAISDITNPFYNEIIRGAQVAATEAGYTILRRHAGLRRGRAGRARAGDGHGGRHRPGDDPDV